MDRTEYQNHLRNFFSQLSRHDSEAMKLKKIDAFRKNKNIREHLKIAAAFLVVFLSSFQKVWAQSSSTLIPSSTNDKFRDLAISFQTGKFELYQLGTYVQYLIEVLIVFAGGIAVLFIVIGGYKYIVGGASDDKTAGKKTITYAVAGFIVSVLAWSVVNFWQVFLTQGGEKPQALEAPTTAATAPTPPVDKHPFCKKKADGSGWDLHASCYKPVDVATGKGDCIAGFGQCDPCNSEATASLAGFCTENKLEPCELAKIQKFLRGEETGSKIVYYADINNACAAADGSYGVCTVEALNKYCGEIQKSRDAKGIAAPVAGTTDEKGPEEYLPPDYGQPVEPPVAPPAGQGALPTDAELLAAGKAAIVGDDTAKGRLVSVARVGDGPDVEQNYKVDYECQYKGQSKKGQVTSKVSFLDAAKKSGSECAVVVGSDSILDLSLPVQSNSCVGLDWNAAAVAKVKSLDPYGYADISSCVVTVPDQLLPVGDQCSGVFSSKCS